ncbi:MAG: class I SAM-dependent methyltransferase [Desulfovibrio sp.]|uniref:class I SAM-dependent methyltransferase n=1 Tax=Desulfovibrio sp. 7SRBS1 TaxID=3378064 RepID=UPI003B3CCCB3
MNKTNAALASTGTMETLVYTIAGHDWRLMRDADLETLWARMTDVDNAEDHIPYWAEVWPASLLLAQHIATQGPKLQGLRCLDVGCGLGLSALVATEMGAQVTAFDSEYPALRYAHLNAEENRQPQPLWLQMDWRHPALTQNSFDLIWGGDIVYEKRFFEPLEALFRHVLAPGGKVWLSQPKREVSVPVWDRFASLGWKTEEILRQNVHDGNLRVNVNLRELTLPNKLSGA